MAEAINMHKSLAMGKPTTTEAAGKGSIPKYAKGGAVMSEKGVANLPAKGTIPPLPKPTGKIATLKKGGAVPKRGMGITIAVAVPARKAAGRGR